MFRRDEEEAVPASTFHAEPAYKAEPEPAESTQFSRPKAVVPEKKTTDTPRPEGMPQSSATPSNVPKKYMFPPLSCLQKGKGGGGDC